MPQGITLAANTTQNRLYSTHTCIQITQQANPKRSTGTYCQEGKRTEGLRSSAKHNLLEVPTTKRKKFANRAFSTYGLTNSIKLPDNLCTCVSLDTFKKSLKTYLFKLAYY